MAAYHDQFDDELELAEFDDIPVSSEKIEFDGLKQATAKAERRRERRRRRNERTGKIAACVLLVCLLIGMILALTLVKETEHILYQDSELPETESPSMKPTPAKPTFPDTPSPSIAPRPTLSILTPSPTRGSPGFGSPTAAPTDSPTVTSSPTAVLVDSYTFETVADTYLHLNGPYKEKIYGRQELLSIQRGDKGSTLPGQESTLPTIVSLIEFDTTKESPKALPKRNRWPDAENQVKVTLRINHIPKDSGIDFPKEIAIDSEDEMPIEDIPPLKLEVYRLPNNHDLMIESLSGNEFNNAPRSVKEGNLIVQQMIEPTDTVLDIDVTSAMFLPEDAIGFDDEQVLLLLKVYWEEKAISRDLFASRESDGLSPQLIFSNMLSEEP